MTRRKWDLLYTRRRTARWITIESSNVRNTDGMKWPRGEEDIIAERAKGRGDEQRRGRIWWNQHFDLKGLSKARQLSLIAFGSHAPHIASYWWARGSNKNEIEHLETKQEIVRIHLYKSIFMETVTYILSWMIHSHSVFIGGVLLFISISLQDVRWTLDCFNALLIADVALIPPSVYREWYSYSGAQPATKKKYIQSANWTWLNDE